MIFGKGVQLSLSNVHADICFLGAHAIDLEQGITAPTFEKAIIKQKMIETAERTYILADNSKFNKRLYSKVCNLSEVQGIVTDDKIQAAIMKEYSKIVKIL